MKTSGSEEFVKNQEEMAKAISDSRDEGETNFYSWFNRTGSIEENTIRGFWDFSYYFASQEICRYIETPEEKTCLEIGYGGGRLLNASRNFFNHSIGVDVHPYSEEVRTHLLNQKPNEDFVLYKLSSDKLPIEEATVDFAYSFIVIQHFYSYEIFANYLRELQRVVVPGGMICLYFADLRWYPGWFDRKWIKAFFRGRIEESAPPDQISAYNTLWMTCSQVRSLMKQCSFTPVFQKRSYKSIPDGYPTRKGQQTGIMALKN